MAEDFEILAASVLSGEATDAQLARLEQLLAQNPARRAEFADLRAGWMSFRELSPLAQALEVPPQDAPPERLQKWQAELARKFAIPEVASSAAKRSNVVAMPTAKRKQAPFMFALGLAAAMVALAFVGTSFFSGHFWHDSHSAAPVAYVIASGKNVHLNREGKSFPVAAGMSLRAFDKVEISAAGSATILTSNAVLTLRGPLKAHAAELSAGVQQAKQTESAIRMALFVPLEQMQAVLTSTRSGVGIAIYSPAGFTADLTPVIMWKAELGAYYDVSITDELTRTNSAFRLTRVTSPLDFSTAWPNRSLTSDGLYRLRIEIAGNTLSATEITFRTVDQPPPAPQLEPVGQLLTAYGMLSGSPARIGDALVVLLNSPFDIAESEFATRLKLFAFGQLGYQEEFEATAAKLNSGSRTR